MIFLPDLKATGRTSYVRKLKEVRNMAGKESPLNVGVVKEKIEKGQVKVKATRNVAKKNTPKELSVKESNGQKISEAEIITWLKAQGKAVTSTQLRDGLAFKTRTQTRRVMRRLAKAKAVRITTKKLTEKRRIFMFEVA